MVPVAGSRAGRFSGRRNEVPAGILPVEFVTKAPSTGSPATSFHRLTVTKYVVVGSSLKPERRTLAAGVASAEAPEGVSVTVTMELETAALSGG